MAAPQPGGDGPVMTGRAFHTVTLHKETFSLDTRYTGLRYIGGGAYGSVLAGEDARTGRKVAIKKCRDTFRDLLDAKRILRELKLLRLMGAHENLLWVLDVFVWPNAANFKDVYIVCDLMETDLARIIESPQPLSNAHVKYFTYQLFRALRYLAGAGILHRDLKPQNVLINSNCELVVGDFGLARVVTGGGSGGSAVGSGAAGHSLEGGAAGGHHGHAAGAHGSGSSSSSLPQAGEEKLTTYVVTRWYRAPELLVNCPHYGAGVDVWSVGCILAEMLARRPLLPGRNYQHQLAVTLDVLGPPPDEQLAWLEGLPAAKHVRAQVAAVRKRCGSSGAGGGGASYGAPALARLLERHSPDPAAVDLLARCLAFDPAARITVDEALAHPYLADYHDPTDEPTAPPPPAADFEFEARGVIPKAELQGMMVDEMRRYAASAGGTPRPPQSVRLSAHAAAPAALAPAGGDGAIGIGSGGGDAAGPMELDEGETHAGGASGALPAQPAAAADTVPATSAQIAALTAQVASLQSTLAALLACMEQAGLHVDASLKGGAGGTSDGGSGGGASTGAPART